jgi:putative ABC transport system permease protein
MYYGPPRNPLFCRQIEDRVASLPGVVSSSAAAHLPLRGNAGRGYRVEGRPAPPPGEGPSAAYTVACPGYFRSLGVPVLNGREFTFQDTLESPGVVVINDVLARRNWPNEDPVGKRLAITMDGAEAWLTVVGVVRGVRHWGLSRDVQPQMFRPYTQAAWPWMQVVVRTSAPPENFAKAVREAMISIEPDRPLAAPRTMEEVVRASVSTGRFPMLMMSAFATLALVLAAVGIVGVVTFSVTQRTNEIGIRIALGAQRGDVVMMVLRSSMTWVMLGIVAGGALSLIVSRILSGVLYEVKPAEPVVLALVAALLSLVALGASYVPARRATEMDPLVALRTK